MTGTFSIAVGVVQGDLRYSSHPLAVGHYEHDVTSTPKRCITARGAPAHASTVRDRALRAMLVECFGAAAPVA